MKSKGMKKGGMMKSKGYRKGGMVKSKGYRKGGAVKKKPAMSVAQLRAAAKKKGYKLVKA
tara:strand:+ start:17096 stop:17275 length:180 start_codon:yes stop_codon:yes gene_type:complete